MPSAEYLGSGDITFPPRVGNLYKAVSITSANGTTPRDYDYGGPRLLHHRYGMSGGCYDNIGGSRDD